MTEFDDDEDYTYELWESSHAQGTLVRVDGKRHYCSEYNYWQWRESGLSHKDIWDKTPNYSLLTH